MKIWHTLLWQHASSILNTHGVWEILTYKNLTVWRKLWIFCVGFSPLHDDTPGGYSTHFKNVFLHLLGRIKATGVGQTMPERGGQKSLEEHNCCNRRTKIYSITGKCGSKNREEKKRISLTLYKVSNGQLLSLSTPAFSIRFWSKSFNRGTQMPNLLGASGVYATLPSPPRLLALLHAFLILDRVVVFGTSMPQLPAGISERRGSFFL